MSCKLKILWFEYHSTSNDVVVIADKTDKGCQSSEGISHCDSEEERKSASPSEKRRNTLPVTLGPGLDLVSGEKCSLNKYILVCPVVLFYLFVGTSLVPCCLLFVRLLMLE